MNVGGYGQNIKLIGLRHLLDQGNTESERLRLQQEMNALNSKARGKAIGGVVGSVLGAGKGLYDDYRAGELQADVKNAEAARDQFPDEASYRASIKKNYSPEVRREMALRAMVPPEFREEYGLAADKPHWAYDVVQRLSGPDDEDNDPLSGAATATRFFRPFTTIKD